MNNFKIIEIIIVLAITGALIALLLSFTVNKSGNDEVIAKERQEQIIRDNKIINAKLDELLNNAGLSKPLGNRGHKE